MSAEVYVLEGVRTPRGKGSPRGSLHGVPPLALVTTLLRELGHRGVPASHIEDLVLGCATQIDDQGTNLARTAALHIEGGEAVPGVMLNRFCASGLDAVQHAAARIRTGEAELLVAGGVESVSRVPAFADRGPLYADPAVIEGVGSIAMGVAADLIATREGFTREQLDAYALHTRARARDAAAAGRNAPSLVAVRNAEGHLQLDRDELLDYTPDAATLATLPPAFAELGAAGDDARALDRHPDTGAIAHLHTRASSPALADAAALVVLGTRKTAARLGLRPRAKLVSSASCADDPVLMLTAGQTAAEQALRRVDCDRDHVDFVEFAEAFSASCLRLQRDWRLSADRLNPNGGTIALGHAFGATGAILVLSAVDELVRRGRGRSVVAVSGAAGLGVATVLEAPTG